MARLIVCDDEPGLAAMLVDYLGGRGHEVDAVGDGRSLRERMGRSGADLVILDLSLPGEDGLALARWLRADHDVGIIMLTGETEVVDRVVGLEIGADDYVTKPFSPAELAARIEAVLRRRRTLGDVASFGGCTVDLKKWKVFDAKGEPIDLSGSEIDLVVAFAINAGRVLTRDELLRLAPAQGSDPLDRSIDNRVTRLRRKLVRHGVPETAIETVRGGGYVCRRPEG
ncbi:MAG: DNA-binding response regulator [Ancylobacter novellus]|uniref:DNA-binding response regulator n=1 Tax=Ancylobacter novellus TaxID=921 RepID=A0A2W5K7I5_ANCNO|nr:MAG: DNA-binding response regulator [Ancylobacter novellus]